MAFGCEGPKPRHLSLLGCALAGLPLFGDAAQSMATLSRRNVSINEQVDHAQRPSTQSRYEQENQSRIRGHARWQ
jgi:hypothetical protein